MNAVEYEDDDRCMKEEMNLGQMMMGCQLSLFQAQCAKRRDRLG